MKYLVSIIAFLSFNALAFDVPVRYNYDGDTIMITLDSLPKPLNNASVRILGIDAPEMHGKCAKEIAAAKAAKQKLTDLIGTSKTISLSGFSWDKYGSRIDAIVSVNGVDLGSEMLKSGLVRTYSGGVRASWCK
jgi:endonuclease YncB( thermonuclease family)